MGLYFVDQTKDFRFGYIAVFPIAQIEGLPAEPPFTGRFQARVSFTPVGPLDFDGWTEPEIVQLYNTVYSERCLGVGLGQGLAPFSPTVVYE